jgi:hypothetical protein
VFQPEMRNCSVLVLAPLCHPSAGVVGYVEATGELELMCHECDRLVVKPDLARPLIGPRDALDWAPSTRPSQGCDPQRQERFSGSCGVNHCHPGFGPMCQSFGSISSPYLKAEHDTATSRSRGLAG